MLSQLEREKKLYEMENYCECAVKKPAGRSRCTRGKKAEDGGASKQTSQPDLWGHTTPTVATMGSVEQKGS